MSTSLDFIYLSGLPHDSPVVLRETFAPIVYLLKCNSLDEAIEWNNEVEQGLSSSLFTKNLGDVFKVRKSFSQLCILGAKKSFIMAGKSYDWGGQLRFFISDAGCNNQLA